jgi:hypothetical protein
MADDYPKLVLKRIADALGVDPDIFQPEKAQHKNELIAQQAREDVEMLKMFQAIKDPLKRQSCLEFVRKAGNSTK